MLSSRKLLARFAVESSKLKGNGEFHWRLLKPGGNSVLSVYRIGNLAEETIICIGLKVVKRRKDNKTTLYGWLEIKRSDIESLGLAVDDDDSFPGHSSVIGWPEDDIERNNLSMELLKKATHHPLPTPIQASGNGAENCVSE